MVGTELRINMKRSDRIETNARANHRPEEGNSLSVEFAVLKALVKHIIDNELPHLWRVVLLILTFVLGIGFTVAMLFLKLGGN